MKKILIPLVLISVSAALAHASVLADDSFDYAIGSTAASWSGGSGFNNRWNVATDTKLSTSIVSGLTLGTMSVSGNAMYITYAQNTTGLGSNNVWRNTDFAVTSGDLWLSYLYQFNTAAAVNLEEVALQVRFGTTLRGGINEDTSAFFVQYNLAATKATSSTDGAFKDGTTLLMVYAYYDMGQSAGSAAKGWALTASAYDNLIAAGVTEANLDLYALLSVTTSTTGSITLADNTQFAVSPSARNDGSVMAFTIDEIKIGTSAADVIATAIPEPQTAALLLPLCALAWLGARRRR